MGNHTMGKTEERILQTPGTQNDRSNGDRLVSHYFVRPK